MELLVGTGRASCDTAVEPEMVNSAGAKRPFACLLRIDVTKVIWSTNWRRIEVLMALFDVRADDRLGRG